METRHKQDITPMDDASVEMNADVQYSTNTPGDIITIEDSMSEAESLASDLNNSIHSVVSTTSSRGRKKSRLAANFSGNEH